MISHARRRSARQRATGAPRRRRRPSTAPLFALDAPAETEAVWGEADGRVVWPLGEPFMIAAPQGVGKTTLAQRLALGRMGLCPTLLGMPVMRDERPVFYVAADRPRQAQRSLARMVAEEDRAALRDRLVVWRGSLPFALSSAARAPELLALCERFAAGTLILDSLKDVAPDLSREETGTAVNAALQALVAAGIEVLALHHQTESQPNVPVPRSLADVYGFTWLTAGVGSVVLLWGEPGDLLVEVRHLKQPAEEVGPYTIVHDHVRGLPALHEPVEAEDLLRRAGPEGLTVTEATKAILGKPTPSRNDVEKARRRLEQLVKRGRAMHVPSLVPTDPGRYIYDGRSEQERERA
jgi:replicative DNA helicase